MNIKIYLMKKESKNDEQIKIVKKLFIYLLCRVFRKFIALSGPMVE